MTFQTDPARELSDICNRLISSETQVGADFLASKFLVSSWSAEFYQIVFWISNKCDSLKTIVNEIKIDDDIRLEILSNISLLQNAFAAAGLQNNWQHSVVHYISPSNLAQLRVLSGILRTSHGYVAINDDEKAEILSNVVDLISWLEDLQLSENDFIRSVLIEGLHGFKFRLERMQWVGWSYAVESLRDVIGAYLALERGTSDLSAAPDAAAVLRKIASFVKATFSKIGGAHTAAGDMAFMILAYGEIAKVARGQSPIAGLLTFSGS